MTEQKWAGIPLAMADAKSEPLDAVALHETAAKFKALGDPTRLRIYRFLRDCCCPVAVEEDGSVRPIDGPTVGDVCCHITGRDRISSTFSEHLKELRLAGLIVMERRGKNWICAADPSTTARLAEFFEDSPNLDSACCPKDAATSYTNESQ